MKLPATHRNKRDYPAIVFFMLVLSFLFAAGVYFSLHMERGIIKEPLEMFSKLADDLSRQVRAVLAEFQKISGSAGDSSRQAQEHLHQGYDDYKQDRLDKAIDAFNRTIEIEPQNFEAYFWRGRTYMRKGQFENAVADFKKVLDLNPDYSPACDNLGWLFMRRNDYAQSLAYLNQSIKLQPKNGWAHYMRGRIFFQKGDLKNALERITPPCPRMTIMRSWK
jgi:tetratricopeptide (TPR) repeat protein